MQSNDELKAENERLQDEVERLRNEQKALTDANHRQAMCIHATAQAMGPEIAATIDALPKAAKALQSQLTKARGLLDHISGDYGGETGRRIQELLAHQSAPAAKDGE